MATFKKGSILVFEEGAYSNRDVAGVFRVTKEFTMDDALEEFRKNRKARMPGEVEFHYPEFLGFLSAKTLIVDIDYERVDLGSGGEWPRHLYEKWPRHLS